MSCNPAKRIFSTSTNARRHAVPLLLLPHQASVSAVRMLSMCRTEAEDGSVRKEYVGLNLIITT